MALNNLSSSLIQNTYGKLVQTEGGLLADGTGSAIDSLTVTASYALVAETSLDTQDTGSLMTTGSISGNTLTFTKGDASTFDIDLSGVSPDLSGLNEFTASAEARLDSLEAETGSYATKTELNASSSALTIAYTDADTTLSSSLAADIASNTTRITSLEAETGSYAKTNQNNTFTGTQTFNNIAVNGTGSFAYIEQVTGSAKVIGDAFLILNNDTPTQPYAGIKVQDSGSDTTSSFFWNANTDDWMYEYEGDDTDHGVFLVGPEFATKDSPLYPGNNVIQKGTGGHHLTGSIMTDDGSTVTVSGDVNATNFIGNGSQLTGVQSELSASVESGDLRFTNIGGEVYGSAASPLTGGITISTSTTKVAGATAIVYHQSGSEPTVTNGTIDKKVGTYDTTGLNVITLVLISGSNYLQYIAGTGPDSVASASYADFAVTADLANEVASENVSGSELHLDGNTSHLILSSSTTNVFSEGPTITARGGTFLIETILDTPVGGAGNFKLDVNRDGFINVSDQFYLTTHDGNPGVGDTYWTDNGTSNFQIRANSVSNSGSIWFKPSSAADAGIKVEAVRAQSSISDFSETDNDWKAWVTLGPNTTANPDPAISFQRDVEITGSLSFSGTLDGTITSASYATTSSKLENNNTNSGSIAFWQGTQAEYNLISGSATDDTIYFVI